MLAYHRRPKYPDNMQKEILSLLRSLNLTANEAQTYTGLLEAGPSSIRYLATKTSINRGTTYECLKSLINKGLVSYKQSGERRKYSAVHPSIINDLLDEKQRELDLLQEQAPLAISYLESLSSTSVGQPIVQYYEDHEGVVAILRDVLGTMIKQQDKTYYVYSTRTLRNYIYRHFPHFTQQRVKADIKVKVLAIGTGGDTAKLADRKWLPGPEEYTASYIIIYANKVAQISISADDTPYGVIIEEPGVAAMQKYLFEQMWKRID